MGAVRPQSPEGGKGNKVRPFLVAFILGFLSTAGFAETSAPKKLAAYAKPKEPPGCKLVGTVRSTKLWAGNCVAASELHGAVTAITVHYVWKMRSSPPNFSNFSSLTNIMRHKRRARSTRPSTRSIGSSRMSQRPDNIAFVLGVLFPLWTLHLPAFASEIR